MGEMGALLAQLLHKGHRRPYYMRCPGLRLPANSMQTAKAKAFPAS